MTFISNHWICSKSIIIHLICLILFLEKMGATSLVTDFSSQSSYGLHKEAIGLTSVSNSCDGGKTLAKTGSLGDKLDEVKSMAHKDMVSAKAPSRSLFFTVGKNEEFKTIQSALDSANLYGGGTVYLEPGNYYENLTLHPGITLEGCGIADLRFVCIYGTHRLPEHGELGFNHILFSNGSSVFRPNMPSSHLNLLFRSCFFEVKNGYVLDIPDLKGSVIFFDCCSTGENNGFMNNINGKCEPTLFNTTIDGGQRKNRMFINSNALLFNLHIKTQIEFSGKGNVATINGGCWIEDTMYVMNRATLKISCSTIETQGRPSCFIDKESLLTLDNCSIESSAKEVILGSGSLRLGNASFPSQSKISTTIDIQKAADFFKITKKAGEKGNADSLPAAPTGYLITNINGSEYMIPYYAKP